MDYGDCATESTYKIITVEENNRKFTINNPTQKSIKKVQVDGCLKNIEGKRCDYLFEINIPVSQVIYLELKGCDVEKAYQQLLATINLFRENHQNLKKQCHIVASRVPKAGTKVQQLKVLMKKQTNAELIVSTDKTSVIV